MSWNSDSSLLTNGENNQTNRSLDNVNFAHFRMQLSSSNDCSSCDGLTRISIETIFYSQSPRVHKHCCFIARSSKFPICIHCQSPTELFTQSLGKDSLNGNCVLLAPSSRNSRVKVIGLGSAQCSGFVFISVN